LIRNSKWTFWCITISAEVWRFQIVVSLLQFSKSSILYIEVWKRRCELPAHQNKSRLKLWSITNDLLPDMVDKIHSKFQIHSQQSPMKDQFQIHSKFVGTLLQAQLLFLSCSRDKNWVVEVVVVHFVQLYFVNALQRTSIQCLQIHSN